tara:strand:- start:7 stop:750 length:744 start_codon:yes stop_codon:yes gene_type:complete
MAMVGMGRNQNRKLSDADLAFLRAPENREFAETLNINSNYLFPEPVSGGRGIRPARRTGPQATGIDKDKLESIQSAIIGQKALIEGRKFFAPREAQAANPLVLQALQRSMAQQPMLAGFETQMAQVPQFQQGQANLPSRADIYAQNLGPEPSFYDENGVYDTSNYVRSRLDQINNEKTADLNTGRQFGDAYFNRPALNPYSAPQQFAFGPQMGGMQGGLFNSLATKGQQQIAAGQAMNPTILKAKSV